MQCQSATKRGQQCQKRAISGENMCHIHSLHNCGETRASLDVYDPEIRKLVSGMCDTLPLDAVSNVLGPATYTEWDVGDGRVIGIFGEYHTILTEKLTKKINKKNTLTFSNFLKVLFDTNSLTQYDLFLERVHSPEDYDVQESVPSFYMLEVDFKECLRFIKNCNYKNLRAHSINYGRSNEFWFKNMYDDTVWESGPIRNYPKQLMDIYNEYNTHFDRILHLIHTDRKILKQLSSTGLTKEIIDYIEGIMVMNKLHFFLFLKGKIYLRAKTVRPASESPLKIKKYSDFSLHVSRGEDSHDIFHYRREILAQFSILYMSLMDIYILGRLFRTFKPPITRSIVYVGQLHADVYNGFMRYMKYKRVIEVGNANIVADIVQFTPSDKKESFLFS